MNGTRTWTYSSLNSSTPRVSNGVALRTPLALARAALLMAVTVGGASPATADQLAAEDLSNAALRPAYEPSWASVEPRRSLALSFDASLSETENGARLKDRLEGLLPGDLLRVGPGRWSVNSFFQVDLQGAPTAPIRIVGETGAVLTRPNAGQNTINFGSTTTASTSHLLLRGFEVEGGSYGIRIQNVEQLWIDQCIVHGSANAGIGANSHDTEGLHITRTEVYDTGGTGEGLYMGGNNGTSICARAVLALNHIHDTGGSQGDGIELKQGSWGCLIAENIVHGTKYPGILVYGTNGQPVNVIESNVIWDTTANPFQVQGEALVRNNLVFAQNGPALQSGPHQGGTTNLKVIGNTFFTRDTQAAFLRSWAGKPGMVLANNVFYSETGESVHVNGGLDGVTVASNVVLGPVWGVPMTGFDAGRGLEDFIDVRWDGSRRDARPTGMSALNRVAFYPPSIAQDWKRDLTGAVRPRVPKIGAMEPGTYGRYLGFWNADSPRIRTRFPLGAGASSFSVTLENVAPFSSVYLRVDGAGLAPTGFQAQPIRGAVADGQGRATLTLEAADLPRSPGEQIVLRAAMRTRSGVGRSRRIVATAR